MPLRIFCHIRHLRASVPGRFFLGGCCLRDIGPGVSRNAGRLLPSPDWRPRALPAGVRREDCGRKREMRGLAKERPFAAGKNYIYISKGFLGFCFGNWAGCRANKKTARPAVSMEKLFETDCFYWRNLCYYIGRNQ